MSIVTILRDRVGSASPALLTVLRVGAALLFMQHGVGKLFGWLTDRPPVELFSQMGLAGVIETFGSLLVLLGLGTRPAALVMTVLMVWAYAQAHVPRGVWPIENHGELALLYGLVWAYLAAAGPGPFSLDRKLGLEE